MCVVRKPSFWHCDYDDDGVPSYVPACKTSFSRIVLYKSRVVLNGIPSHVYTSQFTMCAIHFMYYIQGVRTADIFKYFPAGRISIIVGRQFDRFSFSLLFH